MAKMNMGEKRKIDKLIVADIDAAIARYEAKRNEERKAFLEKFFTGVVVKSAYSAYQEGKRMQEKAEERLREMGLRIGYGGELELGYDDNTELHKKVGAFDTATEAGKERIAQLKKTFALKLFAENEEARKLFELLAKELAKLGV